MRILKASFKADFILVGTRGGMSEDLSALRSALSLRQFFADRLDACDISLAGPNMCDVLQLPGEMLHPKTKQLIANLILQGAQFILRLLSKLSSFHSVAPRTINLVLTGNLCEARRRRSEEHTSELQSRPHLVCRLLLEK